MTDAAQKRYQDMLDRLTKIETRLAKLEKPEPAPGWQTRFAETCIDAGLVSVPRSWFKLVKPHVDKHGIDAVCSVMRREVSAGVDEGTLKFLSIPKLFAVAPGVAHGVKATTRVEPAIRPPTAEENAAFKEAAAEFKRQFGKEIQ